MTKKIYLYELTAYDPSAGSTTVLRYCTGGGFGTRPVDTPADVDFEGRIIEAGNFETHLFAEGTTRGRSEVGYGAIVLNNADGRLDGLIEYGMDGRSLVIRRGPADGVYPSDFPIVFQGTMEQPEFGWRTVTIRIRDRLAEVANKPMQTVKYAGDNSLPNGVEGIVDDLKGLPKPWLFGKAENFSPPLVNTSQLIYQLSHRQIASIQSVYDMGVALTPGTPRASLALLLSNTPAGGTFDYYLGSVSDGAYIKLGSSPTGQITVDATQGASASDRTVAQIVKSILINIAGISSGDIDDASVTETDAANSSVVGIWVGTGETAIGEVLEELCASIGASWYVSRAGEFKISRFAAPSGTAETSFESWQLVKSDSGVERIASNDQGNGLPVYRVNLGYRRNFTLQSEADLAGAALTRLNFAGEEYRYAIATDASVQTAHLLAEELKVETLLTAEADAQAEATRLQALYGSRRDLLQLRIDNTYTEAVDLNDVIEIAVNRFDWGNGKNFRVIGKVENFSSNITVLIVWG